MVLFLCLCPKEDQDTIIFTPISLRTLFICSLVLHSFIILLYITDFLVKVLAARRKREREERRVQEMLDVRERRLSGDTERGSEHSGRTSKDSNRTIVVSGRANGDIESASERHADKSLPGGSSERANEQSSCTHKPAGRASENIGHADEGSKQVTPRSLC